MNRRFLIIALLVIAVSMLVIIPAAASVHEGKLLQDDQIDIPVDAPDALVAGNYCISCHMADDPRLVTVTQWKGSIASEVNSPCPASTKIHEELYYTERLLLMIERAQDSVGTLPEKTQARLNDYTQRYSRMLDVPVTSLDAFVSEAQSTRFQLNKIYTALNDRAESAKQRTALIYAAGITLVVAGSLVWGLYNTRTVHTNLFSKSRSTLWRAAFVIAVLAFFVLPIFRVPAVEVTMTTAEQQEAQTVMDSAQRAADAADRSQARAWMLARIGTAWNELDSAKALNILDESLVALEVARQNEEALWGQSFVVQEVTIGTRVEMESARLIAGELNASRARAWAVPLVAVEWYKLDPEKGAALLTNEFLAVQRQTSIYRDLQMRSLALAWLEIENEQSTATAAQIADPSIRAWTFRELAAISGDSSLYADAIEAARSISDPVQGSRALSQIASMSGQTELYTEALNSLDSVSGAPLAYALSDLAVASTEHTLVDQIDPDYPNARVTALLGLGEYQLAWEAASQITDPYERGRAEAAIASAWGNAEVAMKISVPLYRDIALRDVIQRTGNMELIETITLPYYQVQALTALGDYEAALELVVDLGDAYPLVALAKALAGTDLQASLAVVEQMTRESDKAIALQAISASSEDQTHIEQALGMALAGRVRGDTLVPAQASLDLANVLWTIDQIFAQSALLQAYEAAQRIAIK